MLELQYIVSSPNRRKLIVFGEAHEFYGPILNSRPGLAWVRTEHELIRCIRSITVSRSALERFYATNLAQSPAEPHQSERALASLHELVRRRKRLKLLDWLDIRPGEGPAGYGPSRISALPPEEAASLLLAGSQSHPSNRVRARCIHLLLSYDLDDKGLSTLGEALQDRSAEVRHAAISFFGLRGMQGRPVLPVVKDLVQFLEVPPPPFSDDLSDENTHAMGIPMAASSAIKLTVGAKKIMIPGDTPCPGAISRFLAAVEHIATDPKQEAVLRDDATLYLKALK
jgi:hypothetical protein